MESDEIREALRQADRGAAAPWIDCPPMPRWWPALVGAWALAYVLNIGYNDGLLQALGSVALLIVMGIIIGWQRVRRGTYPVRHWPRELWRSTIVLIGGVAAVALLAWLLGVTTAPWVAAVAAGVGAFALAAAYERIYESDAARLRERLG